MHELRFDGQFAGWRSAARAALAAGLSPAVVRWRGDRDAQTWMFTTPAANLATSAPPTVAVSRAFLTLARDVACHVDTARWDVLYRALWRLTHGEPHLLDVYVDDDVHRLQGMAKAVRREGHKLRAFVRFRLVGAGTTHERCVAWFEPTHDVVAREAPFFARRFPAMRWSILTPMVAAHWDGLALTYAPGVSRLDAPGADDLEDLWRTYYASTFNPARVKPRMMRAEMPVRYWKHLPEASLIAPLLREAPGRVQRMLERQRDAARGSEAGDVSSAPRMIGAGVNPGSDIMAACARSDRARAVLRARDVAPGRSPVEGRAVRVGTASWTDPSMTAPGVFYPQGTRSAADRLAYYASRFSFVEVDATYYSLPSAHHATLWAERTPRGFLFDIKAHAVMTGHTTAVARLPRDIRDALPRRLASAATVRAGELSEELVQEVWRRFVDALQPLRTAGKLGALLLQLPRDFTPSPVNERAIAALRERAGEEALCAVELRHADWVTDRARRARTLSLLRAHDLAYVMVDAPPGFATSMPPLVAVTSDRLAIVRLHGRRTETWERPVSVTSERYRYLYDAAELGSWVPRIIDVAQRTQGVHVVMNNCHANYGTTNADEISALLVEADLERRRLTREGRVIRE